MKTFRHSGKCGDLIFSLPTIKAMGGGTLYLPEIGIQESRLYSNMRDLLLLQDYIHDVIQIPDCTERGSATVNVDIDLDRHFEHKSRGLTNMVQRYFDIFKIKESLPLKWMEINSTSNEQYAVINVTPRFRDYSTLHWGRVLSRIDTPVYFVGTKEEHKSFVRQWGDVQYLYTHDVLNLAQVVNAASKIYCNQSLVLALAIALDKERYVEFKPSKDNCKFYTKNEHQLI